MTKKYVLLIFISIAYIFYSNFLYAEEYNENAILYIEGQISALNVKFGDRQNTVKKIAARLKDKDSEIIHQVLIDYLQDSSVLIQMGIVESLARAGKPESVVPLCRHLKLTDRFEVRLSILRLLPAFIFTYDERLRISYIEQIDTQYEEVSSEIIVALQQPPFSKRGRFLPELDQIKKEITLAAASQLDLVSTLLKEYKNPENKTAAFVALKMYLGDALGNDATSWQKNWEGLKGTVVLPSAEDIEEINLAALKMLDNIGAETFTEILHGFDHLLTKNQSTVTLAIFNTLTSMLNNNYNNYLEYYNYISRERNQEIIKKEEEWKNRIISKMNDLLEFSFTRAKVAISSSDPAVRAAAILCLTESVPEVEDLHLESKEMKDEKINKRLEVIDTLNQMFLFPDEKASVRKAIAMSFAKLPDVKTTESLHTMITSPYVIDNGGMDAVDLARVILESLAKISMGGEDGAKKMARKYLLSLLASEEELTENSTNGSEITIANLVLWRLQIMTKTSTVSYDANFWRRRLGWDE